MKYTIKQFNQQFPDDKACLEFIFKRHYPNGTTCKQCKKSNCFYAVKGRRSYACSWCAFQIYPTAGSIFHKSRTSLKSWFFAIFLMSQSKNGVSAKELERAIGVTYKTAFRMMKQIRLLMKQSPEMMLSGTVEADETYMGGVWRMSCRNENKTIVIGAVQRKGNVVAQVIDKRTGSTVVPLVRRCVKIGTNLMTDSDLAFRRAGRHYKHQTVNHRRKEYVRGDVFTNTIEGFWSQLKRSVNGTYHAVSRKHLPGYVDEFAWRYNARNSSVPVFELLMRQMAA
jgi:transposase-like protein